MRKYSFFLLIAAVVVVLPSCENLKGGTASSGEMETLQDSLAYFIGSENARQLQELGFDIDAEAFYEGFKAGSNGSDLILDEQTMAMLSMQFQQEAMAAQQAEQLKTNVADGQAAPDLTMATPDGGSMSISDLRGKYVLVDFWASWCKPCRQENPNVVRVYNKYKDQGFEILGVSLDDNKDNWLGAIEQDGLTWQHMSDLKKWSSESVGVYGFKGIPYTVLIDPEGNIVAQHLRSRQLEEQLSAIFGS